MQPPFCPMRGRRWRFRRRVENFQTDVWPSVDLKYALPDLVEGEMYQEPQRSLAMRGRENGGARSGALVVLDMESEVEE